MEPSSDPTQRPAESLPDLREAPQTSVRTYDVSGKADLVKRFVAALIDGVIGVILSAFGLIGPLLGGAYILVRDGLDLDFMDRRSVGKKVMKLRPISLEGKPMDMELSARRNWPLALGYLGSFLAQLTGIGFWSILGIMGLVEAILVLTESKGRRYGDKFANTQVVESDV